MGVFWVWVGGYVWLSEFSSQDGRLNLIKLNMIFFVENQLETSGQYHALCVYVCMTRFVCKCMSELVCV